MKYLFSQEGRNLLESLTFTETVFGFDFDGTLAPIVSDPAKAKMSSITHRLTSELSALVPVAIISGRSVTDLKERLNFNPAYLIGNHGLEGLGINTGAFKSARENCIQWKKQLITRNSILKEDPGIHVEDKGYSLALHYRKSRNKKSARTFLFKRLEALRPPPRIVLGKSVINLIPVGAPHKGVALLEIMMELGLRAALYVGDDDTDEDVFSLPDERIISVRVGQKKSSHAKFFVKRQTEVQRILRELVRILNRTQKRERER